MISSIGFVGFLTSLFRGLAVFLGAVGPHTIVVFYDVGRGKPLTSSVLFLSFMLILLGSLTGLILEKAVLAGAVLTELSLGPIPYTCQARSAHLTPHGSYET